MLISLRRIAEITGQGILPASGVALPEAPISGVHLSELLRPGQYLDGGELLITTAGFLAAAKPEDADAIADDYVMDLRSSGIGALALGLDVHFDRAPRELIDACERHGVPLAVIPARTRFQTLTRAFWTAQIEQERNRVQRLLSFQARLSAAVAGAEPIARLVELVAIELGGWAVYLPLDTDAAPALSTGLDRDTAGELLPALRAEALRGASLGPLTTASYAVAGTTALQFPVALERTVVGYLIAEPGTSTPAQARTALLAAASLISAAEARSVERRAQGDAHRALVVTLLIEGHLEAARLAAAALGTPSIPEPVEALVIPIDVNDRSGSEPSRTSEELLARLFGPADASSASLRADGAERQLLFLDGGGHRMVLLDRASASEVRAAGARAGTALAGVRLSPPIPLVEFPRLAHELLRYPDAAAGSIDGSVARRTVVIPAAEPITAELLDGMSPREWIARLHEHSQADLVRTARSVLETGFSHVDAAADLGVHRNTIRYRVRVIEGILGRPLSDPDVISALWPELRGRRPSAQSAESPPGP